MNAKVRILGLVLVLAGGFHASEVGAQQSIPDRLYQLEQRVYDLGNGSLDRLWLRDINGTWLAHIGKNDAGQGAANFHNSAGNRVLFLGSTDQGNGGARFWNAAGYEVLYIGSHGYGDVGGGATFFNSTGNVVAYIGASGGYGTVRVNGTNVHDYAEVFELETRDGVSPGTVMSVLGAGVALAPSASPYDPKVVGVVSGAGGFSSGMRIGTREDGSTDLPIAMSGQVYVRVCLENGPIQVGDLLVASSRSGLATRATDKVRAIGAVVGKALEPYRGEPGEDEGLIRMLVMTR